MPEERNHIFDSDHPIKSKADDILGRGPFAESLAKAILAWKGKESIVIGLQGEWGQGKTSVKNLVVEYLKEKKNVNPVIVDFNPWQWSGQNQIAQAFFSVVASQIKASSNNEKFLKDWICYAAACLELGRDIISDIKPAIQAAFCLISATVSSLLISLCASTTGKLCIAIFSVLVTIFCVFSKYTQRFADYLKNKEKTKPLEDVKKDLIDDMSKRDSPVLIIIDDIDRLTEAEIRLVFQLVKTNSDFPNMVFMLLFQRNIAEKAVEGSVKDSGRGYLEKIVNVSFTVPTISSITLGKYFTMEMDRIFKGSNFSESELDRFKSLYWNGVSKYAQNIRAVKRLVSSLTFSISLLRNGDSLEVNPTDIVAIETLRLFEGDIYEMLPRLKELLRKACIYNNERKQVQAEIERAVAIVADEERRSAALNIIHLIFPFGSNTDGWYRDKRICHDCLFDRYFLLRLCDDDISHAEIERLVKISGNYDIFITALRNYIRQGRIDNLLSRMEYYKVIIPPQNLNAFISAIFDIGDELIDDKDASFFLTASDYASRIARRALMEEKDIDKRGIILADTISKTSGLLLPVGVISLINNDYLEKEVDDNTLMELKKICVNKIRNSPDKILSNSHPRRIIYIWTEWASQREVSDWFAAQITNHDALRKIIVAYTSCVNSSAVPHQRWYSALEEIEKYVNIDDLEREVKNLDKSKLNSEELRALNAFDKALSRKKAGKPYDNKSLTKDDT